MSARLLYGLLSPLLLSFGILVAAWLLAPFSKMIPASFAGLWEYGPWFAFAIVALLGVVYRRGRLMLVSLLFALGFALEHHVALLEGHGQESLRDLVVAVLVPLNLTIVGWLQERGVLTVYGVIRLAAILGQLLLFSTWWRYWPDGFSHFIHSLDIQSLKVKLPANLTYPHLSYPLMVICGFALLIAAIREKSYFAYGLFAAFVAYTFAFLSPGKTEILHSVAIGTGFVLGISLLRDAYNLAYRDELTGLPQRRGLNELCLSLAGDYAVAMVDVDHFKKFNDRYGHDTGDDVLKMVASQIARVGDGGKAFRYGGEEFTIVYPSKSKEQAVESLQAVREAIENYEMVVRAPRQAMATRNTDIANRGRGPAPDAIKVSVTISIGVADRSERNDLSDDVIKKADEALYKAKRGGRNRVAVWGENGSRPRAS